MEAAEVGTVSEEAALQEMPETHAFNSQESDHPLPAEDGGHGWPPRKLLEGNPAVSLALKTGVSLVWS